MSAQTSKKKRIGSRRSAANQNKTSDADEIHIADSTSVAKSHIPEEHTGSLNLVTNPQNSSPETHRPPSPEHTGHRRKLGSSRKNRGGQHVKELATESYYEAREEVEEKIRGSETPETTQMSLAIQPERKEELCHGREHDMSATHCSTLYSATIPEVQSSTITNCPKADLESLIPKSENLQTDQYENEKDCKVVSDSCKFEETTQGGMDKYTDTPQSEEVKDNAHLGSISVPSYPTVDQQYQTNSREMPEKELSNDSVTEKERKKRNDNTELLTRDGNLQGYYVVSESHIEASVKQFSITPEVTADKSSPREYTELECSIEQEEVLPTDEKQKQIFNLSEVRDAHQSDGAVNKVHAKENKPTEMLDNYYFSESVIHDATENSEIISINLIDEPEVHDTYHSELTVKSTDDSATKQEISNPNNKHDGGINVFDTYQSDKDSDQVKENAHVGTFVGVSKHTSSSLHSSSTVDQQLINQTSSTEMPEEELPNVCSVTEEENKEGEVDTELFRKGGYLMDNFLVSDSHLKSKGIKYSITAEIATEKSSPRENTEPKYSVEQADFSPPKQDLPTDAKQEEILISEVRGAHQLDDTINKVPEQEVEPTEMQDIDYSSESLIPDATENSEIISGNPIDQTEVNDTNQSELTVKSTDDFVSKQEISNLDDKHDDHPETENNFEALDQRNEDYHVHDTKTTQISITERVDTALGQVCEDEGRVEDDIKPSAEQTGHQEKEGVFTKMEESESSLQTLQSGTNAPLDSKPQQTDPDFSPIGNRRKLGSSRKHKGKQHTKDSFADSYHRLTEAVVEKPRDNEPFETTQMSATIETTVQETSMKTMLEGMGTFDTHQTKEDSDQVKENAHVGTFVGVSQHTSSSLHSSSTVDQQLINQTSSTEMPEEELPNVCSVTEEENKEGDVDTELFRKGGYLMDNFLVSDSHLKSKGIKYSITAEITTEKNSPRENTEPKYSVEQADFSPSKQDLPIDAKQEEIFISGVRGAHQLDDTVNKVSEQEVEPTEMQDIDYSSESLIPDATENSEIISGNPIDQTEVNDTNQSELTVKSTDDFVSKQEISNLDDKHDDHPETENNFEALDQRNEDYHVHDTKTTQISITERVDTALGQVCEDEGRVEEDIKPSAEQTGHQEKEGVFTKMEESESSLQTLQSGTNAPLDSKPQQTDPDFSPIGNRRKLGSSRKHKGKQHTKDSLAESYHRLTEAVVEKPRDNEPFETTQMSATIETTVQEISMKTMLEGMGTFDTHQTKEDSDQVKENAHVGTFVGVSKHTSSSLHSSSTVDQQLINQTSSTEMPEEELPNVCSVTEEENKEGDVDTELFRQGGYLMDNYLVSESQFKSEDIEYSVTTGIATEKNSPRENTEPKYSVEQADFSSPKQDLPIDAKQEEIFISGVRGAHQLDDTVNKVSEQEVEPTEMQDIDYSSESLIPDATENSEIISGNPIDQTEVNDTNQSELTVKSTDDSVSKQEISNLGDKHDDHPETENNFEALDQRNEDYHVHDTKTTQISITERVDTALGQVCEDEGRVEDDIKPSAEQTGHQEKEGVFTKMEESESSLQTLQSGTNAPLDSKPQQTDPDFSPIGNRRKLGSSRKHKGKQHTKDSFADSYHRLTEAVVEKPRDNETTQMSATIETTVQETSMKTMLEGMGTFDTHQTKEDSDQVKENALVGTFVGVSQHTSSSLHSSSIVDQQLINQTSSTEMPEEELPNVCSVTEEENKEGDVDTELFRQDNYLVSESHLKSKGIKYSITAEIATEKNSPRENTEPKYSVEQADFSPPKQDLPIDAKQEEIFISGVRGAHQLDDTVNKVSEQEVEPTEMQDIDYSSESLIPDATENSEIISGNPIDQTEVNDTNQSELTVKSTDDSVSKQEISNLDDKHDDHPETENNFEALDQRNEDYHVHDTKTTQISITERVDTALGQVCEDEGRVEDDIKPSAEQTGHQEKEGVFTKMEESESSLQTLQSGTNAPLDSKPQQTDPDFSPIGNRRKLGSSRKHKGKQHTKDSLAESYHRLTEAVVEKPRDNETTQMSATIETTVQETSMKTMLEGMGTFDTHQTKEDSDQVKENALVGTFVGVSKHTSSSLHSSSTVDQQLINQTSSTEMPEEELPNVCSVTEEENKERDVDTELFRQGGYLMDNYLVSESQFKSEDIEYSVTTGIATEKNSPRENTEPKYSVEQADFSSPKQDLPIDAKQEEIFISGVRGAHQLDDTVNKVSEQEVEPTEMQDIDYSSESLIPDATENSEIISGNPIDQTEVNDTNQSELTVKSTDDSVSKQEISNLGDKHDDHPETENNFEALDHRNEDYHVHDTKTTQISITERVDTALGQVCEDEGRVEEDIKPSAEQTGHQEKEGVFTKMEESESSLQTLQSGTNAPLDSKPQQTDPDFSPIGNRRKLGSSRKHKGKQHTKDSLAESYHRLTEAVVEKPRDNETTQMSATIETTVQETSMKTMLEGMGTFDTHQTKEDSDQVKENAHVGTFVGVSKHTSSSLHSSSTVDQQLINQTSSTEMPEEELPNVCSVTEEENKEGDVDTELFRQDNYLVSESHLKSDGIEYSITAEIATEKSSPREHTEPKCSIEKADFSSLKEELSTDEEQKDHVNFSKVRGAQHSEDAVNEVHEEEVKPTEMQEKPHMDYSLVKESESSLQTQQSKMNAHLDSQPLDNSQGIKEQTHTGFKPTAIRRKLGSSRRNKGIHQEPKEEFAENTRDDDDLANSKLSLGMAMRQKELKELSDLDLKHAKKTRKIRSAVNDEDTTPEEDLILSQNVMDNSTTVTTIIKEPKNLSQLTGNDTVKMDSIQWKDDSNIQNISYHDDNVTARSVMSDVLEQDEAFQVHNTEALTCDKDSLGQEVNMQQTNDAIETVQDVTIRDYSTEVESFVDIQVSGQDDVAETIEHPTKKDHEAQEMTASLEITRAANNRTVTWAPFDKENFRKAEPAGDMSEESGISTAVDASDNQQGIQKINNLENGVNLQGRSKEKRRKMGSTRGSQLNRKPRAGMDNKGETKESNLNIEADMRSLDKMEEVDELPMNVTTEVSQNENANPSLSPVCKEELEASTVHDKGQKLQSSASDLQSIQSSIVDTDDLKDLLPEQSFTHNEEDACPVNFVQAADVRDSDLSTQNDEERPECVNVIQNQALTSAGAPVVTAVDLEMVKSVIRGGAGEEHKICQGLQEPSNVNVVVHDKNPEMKNASPNLNSTNRRRKMGSTRKNLGSQTKGKDLLQNQKVDDEARETATNVGDIKNESFSGIKEEELQLQLEYKDSDSEQRKEKVFETVAYSHTGESHFKPPAHQTFEENPVSHGQPGETEHQLHPRYVPAIPSTSPKHDVMSETESGRRKRKMGSHRKSRGYQNNENQAAGGDRTTDTYGRDAGSITDESAVKTNEEESLGLDKISEVSKSYEKASPSTSKAGEHSRAVSEKTLERVTAVQHPYAEIHLAQESQNTFSLAGNSGGADLRSNSYNVVMVGDSSVGKTSFMKRAQSGKFSLDLPASVGLDSCMWTVVVDGKPVVLQLWDTAGQERFHSITRQIFHKAQAFLLMYDISSSQSFSAISYWASCIQEGAAENVTILLLGNKSDHAERQVKTQQGEILAKEYNFEFMECSAATGENVIQSLETMARMLSQKADTREEAMVLHKEPQQKKSSGCC